jgi:hypothetical protein
MKQIILKEPVTPILGKNPFGGEAWIMFEPMPNGERGIFWKIPTSKKNTYKYIPIDYRIAKISKLHNIYLQYGKKKLFIYEHIGALRFTGLDSIAISASTWPPYLTSGTMFEKIMEHAEITNNEVPYLSFINSYGPLSLRENGLYKFVEIRPANHEVTKLNVSIDYKKLSVKGRARRTVTDELIAEIFPVGPQGISNLFKFISRLFNLEYHKIVVWPDEEISPDELQRKFLSHTMVDRLGEISLFSHYMLPSCEIKTQCAGHRMVFEAMKIITERENICTPVTDFVY